jgi:hypothetical protein
MKITDFFVFIANIATVLAAFPPEGIVSTKLSQLASSAGTFPSKADLNLRSYYH